MEIVLVPVLSSAVQVLSCVWKQRFHRILLPSETESRPNVPVQVGVTLLRLQKFCVGAAAIFAHVSDFFFFFLVVFLVAGLLTLKNFY